MSISTHARGESSADCPNRQENFWKVRQVFFAGSPGFSLPLLCVCRRDVPVSRLSGRPVRRLQPPANVILSAGPDASPAGRQDAPLPPVPRPARCSPPPAAYSSSLWNMDAPPLRQSRAAWALAFPAGPQVVSYSSRKKLIRPRSIPICSPSRKHALSEHAAARAQASSRSSSSDSRGPLRRRRRAPGPPALSAAVPAPATPGPVPGAPGASAPGPD